MVAARLAGLCANGEGLDGIRIGLLNGRPYCWLMFATESDFKRADWDLLQNGAVSLFWSPEILQETCQALDSLGYVISEVNCALGRPQFYQHMSTALGWEEQFGYSSWGGSLDAFNDGLRYVPFAESGRFALVLHGFQKLASGDRDFAHAVLDLIELSARDHLLEGKLLIALVQSDDNCFTCPEIGGRAPQWNRRELSNFDRGL